MRLPESVLMMWVLKLKDHSSSPKRGNGGNRRNNQLAAYSQQNRNSLPGEHTPSLAAFLVQEYRFTEDRTADSHYSACNRPEKFGSSQRTHPEAQKPERESRTVRGVNHIMRRYGDAEGQYFLTAKDTKENT